MVAGEVTRFLGLGRWGGGMAHGVLIHLESLSADYNYESGNLKSWVMDPLWDTANWTILLQHPDQIGLILWPTLETHKIKRWQHDVFLFCVSVYASLSLSVKDKERERESTHNRRQQLALLVKCQSVRWEFATLSQFCCLFLAKHVIIIGAFRLQVTTYDRR